MDIKEYHKENGRLAAQAMAEGAARGRLQGRAPVGYLNVTEGFKKKVAVDGESARLVRLAFGLVATTGRPLRDVLREVRSYGLASRSGGPMGLSSFWAMLTNPFYAGYVRYKGRIVQGNHESLVDRRLFDIVQIRLKSRNRSRRSSSGIPPAD